MIEILGWSSTFLLGLCGVPQALKAWKTKGATDISWVFLVMWLLGEILACIYVCSGNFTSGVCQVPLLVNYILGNRRSRL